MKVALIVPGGVDRSGEYRVIPVLLALIKRLTLQHELHVFALTQEPMPGKWMLMGAHIHNIGAKYIQPRAVMAILHEHRVSPFDIIHSIWSGACGVVTVFAARVMRIPSVVHVAGGELIALPDINYGGRLGWKGRMREALVLRAATRVTTASAPIIAEVAALGFTAQRIPLGVDLSAWAPRPAVRRDRRGRARLIHVASLNRIKDQGTLLRALATLVASGLDIHLDIVGEDTLHGEVQRLAHSLGLANRVGFHGFLPQQDLYPLMTAAHLMIMSSRHETGPVAMLEAAAVGVPTVDTAVGHIAEWSPSASLAVPVGDWKGLAAAVQRVLEDEDLRLQMAQAAFQQATTEDATFTAKEIQDLYRSLTNLS